MAGIDVGTARTLINLIDQVRERIMPLVERVVDDAASTSTNVTEDLASQVLSTVRTELARVEDEVKKHAPSGV